MKGQNSRLLVAVVVCLVLVPFGLLDALAAPPANDTCGGAIAIPASGPFPHAATTITNMNEAGLAGDPVSACFGNAALPAGVWYSFTPAADGTYVFKTCADSTGTTAGDSAITIYTGGCGAPTSPAGFCDQGRCGNHGYLPVQLTAGTPYLIIIGMEAPPAGAGTALQLAVDKLDMTAPANDTCAGAQELTTSSSVFTTLAGATNDYTLNAPGCFTADSGVSTATGVEKVYSFTAPTAGQYSIRARTLIGSTGTDPSGDLVVYATAACPASSTIGAGECLTAANRDRLDPSATPLQGEQIHCYTMTAGQRIFAFVDSASTAVATSPIWVDAFQCSQFESENNNSPASANSISSTAPMFGAISPAFDLDYFSLGAVAVNSRIFAAIDGGAAGKDDFDLRVTTDTDTLEYDDRNMRTPFGDNSPVLAGVIGTGVATYLQVSQYSDSTDTPYRLLHIVRPPASSAVSESEPNETIAQASTSTEGYFSGVLSAPAPSTDVDVYAFTAKQGADVLIALDAKPVRAGLSSLDVKVSVLDSAGAVVLAVRDGSATENTTSGAGSLTSDTPEYKAEGLVFRPSATGRYYVKIASGGLTAAQFTSSGGYLLSISGGSADGDADGVPDDSDGCPSDANKGSVGACGCGAPDKDDNANGVVDCLYNADLKALLSNLLSQQKTLSLKKSAIQQSARATFKATLNSIKAYTTKSALSKVTVKKGYKSLKSDLKLAIAAGNKALKASTASGLRVARATASVAAKRARKNIKG